jgi:Protein of unknown function (DUF2934)
MLALLIAICGLAGGSTKGLARALPNQEGATPMNSTTVSTLAETQPLEPLLEHEIRLCAFDLYEQRGRMDGHSLEDWLHAEAEVLGKIFSRGA